MVDPNDFPIDIDRYRRAPTDWIAELDGRTVHRGPPHQRMGTRAIDDADWLCVDSLHRSETALRRKLFDTAADEVFAVLDGCEEAADETADLVRAWLVRHEAATLSAWDDTVAQPLASAGLAVQDDLCLMRSVGGRWRLDGALVCFPTYWRLADKIGRDLDAIHGPVPHYAEELAPTMTRFFDRLRPGRIVWRRNWGLTAHPLLFVPDHALLDPPPSFTPERLWLRSELQTLRRLPASGAVLFTIRVQLAPGSALIEHPGVVERIVDAIDGWSPELLARRGGRLHWFGEATEWLRTLPEATSEA